MHDRDSWSKLAAIIVMTKMIIVTTIIIVAWQAKQLIEVKREVNLKKGFEAWVVMK